MTRLNDTDLNNIIGGRHSHAYRTGYYTGKFVKFGFEATGFAA